MHRKKLFLCTLIQSSCKKWSRMTCNNTYSFNFSIASCNISVAVFVDLWFAASFLIFFLFCFYSFVKCFSIRFSCNQDPQLVWFYMAFITKLPNRQVTTTEINSLNQQEASLRKLVNTNLGVWYWCSYMPSNGWCPAVQLLQHKCSWYS